MSLKSMVTVPVGSSCMPHLLTIDAQSMPDTPEPLVFYHHLARHRTIIPHRLAPWDAGRESRTMCSCTHGKMLGEESCAKPRHAWFTHPGSDSDRLTPCESKRSNNQQANDHNDPHH